MSKTTSIIKATILHCILASALLSQSLMAVVPIAKETGFSGFIAGGVMSINYKSNMISGNAFDDEISDNKINSLTDKASTEGSVIPSFDYNIKYTFAEAQTEIFLGTDLLDLLTFDGISTLGVRKNFNRVGILGAGVLFSTLPADVWVDPYDTTNPRQHASRDSSGGFLKWEDIAGSKFGLEVRARKLEIDGGDQSGLNAPYTGQVPTSLTPQELNQQLNRDGDMSMLIANYDWKINEKNYLRTELRYFNFDLDGPAMQHQRTELRLNYLYNTATWKLVATLTAGQDDYDNINPLFGRKADSTAIGAGFTAGYKNPFGWSKHLSLLGTVGAYESDSDIEFYDTSIGIINLSALYKF